MKSWIIAALVIGAAGCTSRVTADREQDDMLLRAGFKELPASTPTRLASLKRLPPNRFVIRKVNGEPAYFFADPVVCNCLYRGSEIAWDAYQREKAEKGIAADQQQTHYLDERLMLDSDWNFPPPGA